MPGVAACALCGQAAGSRAGPSRCASLRRRIDAPALSNQRSKPGRQGLARPWSRFHKHPRYTVGRSQRPSWLAAGDLSGRSPSEGVDAPGAAVQLRVAAVRGWCDGGGDCSTGRSRRYQGHRGRTGSPSGWDSARGATSMTGHPALARNRSLLADCARGRSARTSRLDAQSRAGPAC